MDDSTQDVSKWNDFMLKANVTFKSNWGKTVKSNLSINDFKILRTIGTGSYGRVVLAKEKSADKYYAIKVLEKEAIVRARQLEHIKNECRVLTATNFPFLIHMYYYFQDNVYLYFVLPFIAGGELYSLLRKLGKFTESQSRFYAVQIVLAFEYLHSFNIVYRDLKPENVLLDSNGYLKLADLGFCKVLHGRTYTICGTPEYLAPEVVACKGYELAVDWWALGVLIYEMTAGFPPFYSMDKSLLYDQIINGSFRMIPTFSKYLIDLLTNLMKTDPAQRYGNLKSGVLDIKNHPWFEDIDWLNIFNKQEKAPFVPQLSSPDDTRYYSTYAEESLKTSSMDVFSEYFRNF